MKTAELLDWETYYADRSVENRNRLVERYLGLVKMFAVRLKNDQGHLPADRNDLLQEGYTGLIEAVEKFELSMGFEFSTFATQIITGRIRDGLRRLDWVPRLLRYQNNLKEKETGVAPETFTQLPVDFSARDEEGRAFFSPHLVYEEQPLKEFENKEYLEKLVQQLNRDERLVIRLHYREGLSMSQVGQVMGVSESRVCQMHAEAFRFLKHIAKGIDDERHNLKRQSRFGGAESDSSVSESAT